jgi:hypothetical protein
MGLLKSASEKSKSELVAPYVDRVACQEDPFILGEIRSNALSNLIRCPPVAVLVVNLIWSHDRLSRLQDHFGGDFGPIMLSM